jgi:hypothetical protein
MPSWRKIEKQGGESITDDEKIYCSSEFRFIRIEAKILNKEVEKDVALDLAERFVNQDKVDFLMGPTSSGIAMGLTEFARENKKILVMQEIQCAKNAATGNWNNGARS